MAFCFACSLLAALITPHVEQGGCCALRKFLISYLILYHYRHPKRRGETKNDENFGFKACIRCHVLFYCNIFLLRLE